MYIINNVYIDVQCPKMRIRGYSISIPTVLLYFTLSKSEKNKIEMMQFFFTEFYLLMIFLETFVPEVLCVTV